MVATYLLRMAQWECVRLLQYRVETEENIVNYS